MLGIFCSLLNLGARTVGAVIETKDSIDAIDRAKKRGSDEYLDRHGVPRLISNGHPVVHTTYHEGFQSYVPGAKEGDILRVDVYKGKPKVIDNLTAPKRQVEQRAKVQKAIDDGKTVVVVGDIEYIDKNGKKQKKTHVKDLKTGQNLIRIGFYFYMDLNNNFVRLADEYIESMKGLEIRLSKGGKAGEDAKKWIELKKSTLNNYMKDYCN